ncbi:zinc finger protein 260-like [Ochlerotatus camptorhynchus]|uniref:zinc finger protein 260-like n=1 Tax=Ochlerotatus camptorhynchus TaxID=644619 RepID=UPI0031DD51F2
MDQPCSSQSDFWTSFKTEGSHTPSQDYLQPKKESSEYLSYFDIETFYDSVAYGDGPACHVKPDYPFSWGAQTHCSYSYAQSDDGPLDQNNNHNNNYCDLTSYQDLESVAQADLCTQVAQEVASFPAGESFLSPILQESDEVPPELVKNLLQMEESSMPVPIKQEISEEIPAVPPPVVEFPFHLPLKKRRYVIAQHNADGKYPCPSCDRAFNRQGHLTQHCNAHHSGPMEQRCHICGKRFRLREELEKHQLRHKEQNKTWECEHCPKKFNYKFDMIRHVKAVHTEAPHSCQFCGKGVVRLDHLRQHENKHRRMMKNAASKVSTMKRKRDDNDG